MDYKRDRPIALIKAVEPTIKANLDLISVKADNAAFYILKDKVEYSKFYFIIYREKGQISTKTANVQLPVYIQFYPSNLEDLSTTELIVDRKDVAGIIQNWISVLKEYNNTPSVFDDAVLNSYKDEFYEQYKVVDEDANIKPFNLQQQLFIDNYLDYVIHKAPDYKTADNEADVEDIINDAKELKTNLTTLTKQKVIDGLCWMWAKMQKNGLLMLKGLFLKIQDEGVKEGVKEITKFMIDLGKQIVKSHLESGG